jgi:hypothetical protein
MKEIDKLSKYGLVKTCKIVGNNVVTIVVTTGFSQKSNHTMGFMKDCIELFPDFPVMETCITEDNLAIMVLKKTSL